MALSRWPLFGVEWRCAHIDGPDWYADGTLVLDFVDAKTRRLVFRGVGKGVVGSRESTARNIEDAVARIVAAMPQR